MQPLSWQRFYRIVTYFYLFLIGYSIYRKLAMRQQQMDDRRRQNMNHEYGRGGPAPAGDVGGDDA